MTCFKLRIVRNIHSVRFVQTKVLFLYKKVIQLNEEKAKISKTACQYLELILFIYLFYCILFYLKKIKTMLPV